MSGLRLTLCIVCSTCPVRSPLQPRVLQVHDNSSYHRQATADALPIARDSPSIRRILGDTSDPLCVNSLALLKSVVGLHVCSTFLMLF